MNNYCIFNTDFAAIQICFSHLFVNNGNQECTFDTFSCGMNPKVTEGPSYVFNGAEEVEKFLETIINEISDEELEGAFKNIVMPRISMDHQPFFSKQISKNWKTLRKDFKYSIAQNGDKVGNFTSVFRFQGPLWIGHLIEGPILNMINGATARATNHQASFDLDDYRACVASRAAEYKKAAGDKNLFEGGYKFAPSFGASIAATHEVIKAGWIGTSNVAACAFGLIPASKVMGFMNDSYVSSFEEEIDAMVLWGKIFPRPRFLVDMVDVKHCISQIVANKIKPTEVKMSSDWSSDCQFIREKFDSVGWTDSKICLDGNLYPEEIAELIQNKIPFDSVYIDSEIVNPPGFDSQNANFIYTLTDYEKNRVKTNSN